MAGVDSLAAYQLQNIQAASVRSPALRASQDKKNAKSRDIIPYTQVADNRYRPIIDSLRYGQHTHHKYNTKL